MAQKLSEAKRCSVAEVSLAVVQKLQKPREVRCCSVAEASLAVRLKLQKLSEAKPSLAGVQQAA